MSDLAVVGPDPSFGGGAAAHTRAFLDAADALGRDAELLYVPHPALGADRARLSLERIEALRIARGSRRLVPAVRAAAQCWVAGPLAMHGYAAALSGRPYACWAGTSLADENRGRLPGLDASRRLATRVNAPFLARLERTVLRGAVRVYATSAASRAALERTGAVEAGAVGLLPLPVDTERFAPEADDSWLARLERPVLAVVGRADDPRRNLALAIEALPLIRASVPNATLRVIGPRPPQGSAGEGVEVLGEVVSVAEPLREASLLLLPSRQEGFGLAAAEALASGVPVVATPSGGPEELLRASGGGVVLDGWTARELADRSLELLGDVATLSEMRRRGRDYVSREHSPARVRELVAAALAELA
jgi:glycosyltransferase involved in cell wall biosynthesis